MKRRVHPSPALVGLLLVGLIAATAGPATAWEDRAHRLVVNRAVDTLPYPLRAYFEANRRTIAELCEDPSQWGDENPRPEHGYIRLDAYGRYPFPDLPRDFNQAARRFGRAKVAENGLLPWQIGTYSLKLEEAFRAQQWDDVKLYAAILAHYVIEAHDPFNTTLNSDGQLSNQPGLHRRYTASLVDRYSAFFIIRPGGAYKIDDPTRHAFGIVLSSHTWVDNLLFADSQARAGKVDYSDEYYDAFFEAGGAFLIRQLTDASQNVGSYWYTAWENAGRPALPAQ